MSDTLQHVVSIATAVFAAVALLQVVFARRVLTSAPKQHFGFAIEFRGQRDLAGIEEVVFHVLTREGDASVPELAVATRLTPDEVEAGLERLAELQFVVPLSAAEPRVWRVSAPPRPKTAEAGHQGGRRRSAGAESGAARVVLDDVDAEIDAALARLGA